MKRYHLTQEQATELFEPIAKPIKTLVGNDREAIYFVTDEQLQAYANAVLDKVLGEPVSEVVRNDSGQIFMTDGEGNSFDMSKNVGAKLYAPKEQS